MWWLVLWIGCAQPEEGESDAVDTSEPEAPVDDCEADPERFPGNTEIPYDGIDQNCDGADLVDVDGDGYPGVLRSEYEAMFPDAPPWPAGVADGPVDCDDRDATVHPGVSPDDDLWYDGIDSDCAGNNDFDQDGDGYLPTWDQLPDHHRHAADAEAYAALYDSFVQRFHDGDAPWGEAVWGDCLDEVHPDLQVDPAHVHPGAQEVWYDGVDSDCAGDNDFDQDGDGYMPDVIGPDLDPTQEAFDDYVAIWGYDHLLSDARYGDCDDTAPAIFPGALERFGDSVDHDCDGNPLTTPFAFGDYAWEAPRRPRLLGTDTHYAAILTATALDYGVGAIVSNLGVALTFERPDPAAGIPGAGYGAEPAQRVMWQGTSVNPIHQALDAATDGVDLFAGHTFTMATTSVLSQIPMTYSPTSGAFTASSAGRDYAGTIVPYEATDLDLILDADGVPWSVACDASSLHVIPGGHGAGTGLVQGSLGYLPSGCDTDPDMTCAGEGPRGGICFFDGPPVQAPGDTHAVVHICEPAVGCETWRFTPDPDILQPTQRLTLHDEQPFAGWPLAEADARGGWHLLTDPVAGARVQQIGGGEAFDVLGQYALRSFDAVRLEADRWYFAAITDVEVVVGGQPELQPTVVVAWGDPAVTGADGYADLQTLLYPLHDPARPALVPTGVSIHADSDRLALVVSAANPDAPGHDAVGWAFMGWP